MDSKKSKTSRNCTDPAATGRPRARFDFRFLTSHEGCQGTKPAVKPSTHGGLALGLSERPSQAPEAPSALDPAFPHAVSAHT